MSQFFRINSLDRYERRPYDRPGSRACIAMAIFIILLFIFIYIGPVFLISSVYPIVFAALLAGVLISGFIALKVYQGDRRRRKVFRERAYRQHQYPARYPFTGQRLDLDSNQDEINRLQSRISDLEDQLASVRQQRVKEASAAPEVVEVVEISEREPALESKADAMQLERQLLREELMVEKAAIDVLLAALEEAMAKGAISEKEYLKKQARYQKELRRLDKKLQSLG